MRPFGRSPKTRAARKRKQAGTQCGLTPAWGAQENAPAKDQPIGTSPQIKPLGAGNGPPLRSTGEFSSTTLGGSARKSAPSFFVSRVPPRSRFRAQPEGAHSSTPLPFSACGSAPLALSGSARRGARQYAPTFSGLRLRPARAFALRAKGGPKPAPRGGLTCGDVPIGWSLVGAFF